MNLSRNFRSMKDIAIGVEDGDPEAIILAKKLDTELKTKVIVYRDTIHNITYAFELYNMTEKKFISTAYYKYQQYCARNNYPIKDYFCFNENANILSKRLFKELLKKKPFIKIIG